MRRRVAAKPYGFCVSNFSNQTLGNVQGRRIFRRTGFFSGPGVPCLALGVDTVFFRFSHHRRLADAQATGGLVGAARFGQSLGQHAFFQSLHGPGQGLFRPGHFTRRAGRFPHVGRQVGRSDDFRLGQRDQGLDHGLQLAHVARPVVGQEELLRARVQALVRAGAFH